MGLTRVLVGSQLICAVTWQAFNVLLIKYLVDIMYFCLWMPNIERNKCGNLVSLRGEYKWLERRLGR